jgi:hypothetical protein
MENRLRGIDQPETSITEGPGRRWEATRVVLSVMYLLGALAHIALGFLAPEIYVRFADQALVGVYTDVWTGVVVPNLWIMQPLVAVFEFGLAIALLWRRRVVQAAHAAGAVFQAGLILSGPWGPVNAVLALVHVAALRSSYPETILTLASRRIREVA